MSSMCMIVLAIVGSNPTLSAILESMSYKEINGLQRVTKDYKGRNTCKMYKISTYGIATCTGFCTKYFVGSGGG